MRLTSTSRSGSTSGDDDGAARLRLTSQSGSMSIGDGAAARRRMTSQSGSLSADEGASMRPNLSSCSGSAGNDEGPMSLCLTSRSGTAGALGKRGQSFSSLSMSRRSGTDGALGKRGQSSSSLSRTTPSGSQLANEGAISMGLSSQSGSGGAPAAGQPAALVSAVASDESDGTLEAGIGGASRGGPKGSEIKNPWNVFQHANRQQGLHSTALSKMYKEHKSMNQGMP